MWEERLSEFVTLFLVVNPIGVIPVYLALIGNIKPKVHFEMAATAALAAFVVLVFFMFAGEFLLDQMKIPLRAFQISGGVVLFIVALEMVRGEDHSPRSPRGGHLALAIYPLAIPKIAGPGAMLAIILLSDNDRANVWGQLGTASMLALVMVIQFTLLLAASPVSRLIGASGAAVIGRVMGILLAALAVSFVLTAIGQWLNLPTL
jgi:multiple antibiotic resistance protein